MTQYVWWGLGLIILLGVLVLAFVWPNRSAAELAIPRVPRSKIHWIAIILLTICIVGLIGMIVDKEFRDEVSGPTHAFLFIAAGALYLLADMRYYLSVIAGKQSDMERKSAEQARREEAEWRQATNEARQLGKERPDADSHVS